MFPNVLYFSLKTGVQMMLRVEPFGSTLLSTEFDGSNFFLSRSETVILITFIFYNDGVVLDRLSSIFNTPKENISSHVDKLHNKISSFFDIKTEGYNNVSVSNDDISKVLSSRWLNSYISNKNRLSAPLSVTIAPANKCNVNCKYCYADLKRYTQAKLLDISIWLKFIKELRDEGVVFCEFSGSDPMQYSNIFTLISSLVQFGISTSISTKTCISKEFATQLKEIGFNNSNKYCRNEIQISLDPYGQASDLLVRKPGHYKSMLDTLKHLTKSDIDVVVKSVLTTENSAKEYIYGMFNDLHNCGVKKWMLRSMFTVPEKPDINYLVPSNDTLKSISDIIQSLKDKKDLDIVFSTLTTNESGNHYSICSGGVTSLFVRPDGYVTLCEPCQFFDELVVGNIEKESLSKIWNGEKLHNLRFPQKEKLSTECFNCSNTSLCIENGFCPPENLRNGRHIYAPEERCLLKLNESSVVSINKSKS